MLITEISSIVKLFMNLKWNMCL